MTEIKINGNYDYIIGIDPDVDKSGVAWTKSEMLELREKDLYDLFQLLEALSFSNNVFVRLEAGHTVKSTWHKGGNGMAKRVGANHEIGRQIEKFCKRFNIDYELVKPCGLSSINHETFCKITGWDIKSLTNPEKRVAGLLAYSKHKNDYAAW